MKILFSVIACCVASNFVFSQKGSLEFSNEVKKALKHPAVGTYTMQYFADLARYVYQQTNGNDAGEAGFQLTIKNANSDIEKFTSDFGKIITQTQERMASERIVFKTVEYSGRLIMSPVESIPIWGPIQKEINNRIFAAAENELTDNFKSKLSSSLQQLRAQNEKKYNRIIKSGNYDEVSKALDEVHFFANQSMNDVDPAFKEVVEKTQEKFLRESVNSTLKRVIGDMKEFKGDVRALDKRITKLSQFTYEFAAESTRNFEVLVENQQALNDKLTSFYDQYKTDKKALDFMQDFMYSRMNTSEKIQALKAGLLSNLTEEERGRLIKEKELEEEKEKVIRSAGEFLNSASMSIQVLNNLGLGDSKLVQTIGEIVGVGQTVVSAIGSLSSGNFLEFAVSITGIFGRRGPDIATLRHKQIMQRFDQIDTTLNRIEKKIDILLKGQEAIINLQIKTFTYLDSLAYVIQDNHMEQMKQLTDIENSLYENRKLIINAWENSCQACLVTISQIGVDVDKGVLPNPATLEDEYVNLKTQQFLDCEQYIRNYIFSLDAPSINPIFHLTAHIDKKDVSNYFKTLDTINRVSFDLLFNYSKPIGKLTKKTDFLSSLFFPVNNLSDIDMKCNADTILMHSAYYPLDVRLYLNVLKPEVCVRHGFVIRNIGILKSLTDEDRKLIGWEEFTKEKPPRHRSAVKDIENAIGLGNIALVQQNIIAGDLLIPLIFNESYTYQLGVGDTSTFHKCNYLMTVNQLLAKNFARYFVRRYLQQTKVSELQYAYAYNTKDSLVMNKIMSAPFPISYVNDTSSQGKQFNISRGWYMWIGNRPYEIATPNQINYMPVSHTEYLSNLITNRELLLRMVISQKLPQTNLKESLNYLLWK